MNHINIPDDVADILRRSTITETSLKLPGQLSGPDYEKVMKVINAAGGKWVRKLACHTFDRDPREIFASALTIGKITHVKNATQAFYTPPEVVATLMVYADIEEGERCLEPSSGAGSIADAMKERGGEVVCIELDPVSAGRTAMSHATVNQDFLTIEPERFPPFDVVVMNPPFTNRQDIDHVIHAMKFLKPGGKLVAVMLPSFETGTYTKHKDFRALMEKHEGHVVERLSGEEFKSSGTSINTVIVRLIK